MSVVDTAYRVVVGSLQVCTAVLAVGLVVNAASGVSWHMKHVSQR